MPETKKNRKLHNKTSNKSRNKPRNKGKTLRNHKLTIVIGKIYANWCGHCMHLKPLWNEMKKNLKKSEKYMNCKFVFIEIEASQEDKGKSYVNQHYLLNSPHKLDLQGGYPTLFKIKGGNLSYYPSNQGRELSQLMSWSLQSNA
jgi:thiol-disulfide isomerase/thioredoxin